MFIAWTTFATRADAEKLAVGVVAEKLAVCAQVEGPIISHYLWQGSAERTEEFRLCLKCLPEHLVALEAWVMSHHPYSTPEWIVVQADKIGEKYLSWATSNTTFPPFQPSPPSL